MPKTRADKSPSSKTDWHRIDALVDSDIERMSELDPENPITREADWMDATAGLPVLKTSMKAQFDVDVIDWFKAQGRGYQNRMNQVLRQFMEKHQKTG